MKQLVILLAFALPAAAQTPAVPVDCIPSEQALVLDAAVRRYEKLKPAFVDAVRANRQYEKTHQHDSTALREKDNTIRYYQQRGSNDQLLVRNANYKATFWQHKAKKRGLIIGIGIALPALYGGLKLYSALKP